MSLTGRSNRFRRFLLVLASVLAVLAVAEIVCRVDAFFPREPYDADKARAWLRLRAEDNVQRDLEAFSAPDPQAQDSSVRPMLHPYLGWSNERAVRNLENETRWYHGSEHANTYDVLVLGGSVAADFGNHAQERLARALESAPAVHGRAVRVWNEGQAGYKAPQTGNLLAWLFALGHAPDAVILIDGFNEVAVATTNAEARAHPAYPFVQYWGVLAKDRAVDVRELDLLLAVRGAQHEIRAAAERAMRFRFDRSALLTRLTMARIHAYQGEYAAARRAHQEYVARRAPDPAVNGPEFDADPDRASDLDVAVWAANARNVHALCRERGVAFLHVLQPTLHDAGSKPTTDEERRAGGGDSAWLDGVRRGYDRLRRAGGELAAGGVPFLDATRVFQDETQTLYVDICHVNARGNEILIDAVASEMLRRSR